MPRKNKSPIFRSLTINPGATGITANDINTVMNTIAGARMKTGLSTKGGIQSSFMKILMASATT